MFQNNRLILASLLALCVLAKPQPAHAEFSSAAKGVLTAFAVIQAGLDLAGAPLAYYSKFELSPIVGDPRRASMEGATAAYGIGAAFSIAAIPAMFMSSPAAVGLLGFGLASEAVGAGLSCSTYGSDKNTEDHPDLTAAFSVGVASLIFHSSTFIGSVVAYERSRAAGSTEPVN